MDVCRLSVSKELGDVIYQHSSRPTYLELLSLAHDVYSDVSAHVEAMACLVKQSRIDSVAQYFVTAANCQTQHLIDVIALFDTVL